jgi:hypothetical protein
LDAFDVIVTLPLELPADCGLKLAVKLVLCPAPSVNGVVIPLKLKPVPLIPTCEMMTLDPPVLVTVADKTRLLPTCKLPKARLVGLDPNAPAATPVPARGMVSAGFDPFDVMVTLPLSLPADCGVKLTLKLVLCPAPSVNGVVIPLKLKPVPLIPICEMMTLDPPVLVTVPDKA